MMQITDKQIVKRCFGRNIETYNNHAVIQQQIASRLTDLLLDNGINQFERVLEVGCGTGFLTREVLRDFSVKEFWINDLVDSVEEEIKDVVSGFGFENYQFIPGDAEVIPLPEKIDAVLTSSCVQWFHHFEGFVSKVSDALLQNGIMAFSTFGEENYKEIKTILNIGLEYKTLAEYEKIISRQFEVIHAEEWVRQELFSCPASVLKHMKQTGVNGLNNSYFGKEQLRKFDESYRQLFTQADGSVCLTYHPIIVIAKKKF